MMHHRRIIFQKIDRREPIAEILEYSNNLDFPLRKMVLYKPANSNTCLKLIPQTAPDQPYNWDTLRENFRVYIQDQYDKQEQQNRMHVLHLLAMMMPQLYYQIDTIYTQYFTAFAENPNMNFTTEYDNFVRLMRVRNFETQHFTQYIDYETVSRWKNFLRHSRNTLTRPLIQRPVLQQPPTTYQFIASTVRNSKFHETLECPICLTEVSTPEVSQVDCGHKFCKTCIRSTIRACQPYRRCGCPMCRAPIHKIVRRIAGEEPAIIDLTTPSAHMATA